MFRFDSRIVLGSFLVFSFAELAKANSNGQCLYNAAEYSEGSIVGEYFCKEGKWLKLSVEKKALDDVPEERKRIGKDDASDEVERNE